MSTEDSTRMGQLSGAAGTAPTLVADAALVEQSALRRRVGHALLILGVCWFFFFHRLDTRDLWSSHEARAAQNAQRMLDDRAFLRPRMFDDRYDYQKPPLYYWLVAAVAWVRGERVDAWSVRAPAAWSAAATVLVIWWWLIRRGRPTAALIAAVALASMQHFSWLGRTGRVDQPLTLCVTIAVLALPNRRWWWVGGLAGAAGLLLKGPVGIVLPSAVIAICVLTRQIAWSWRLVAGSALGVAIALPWFIRANVESDGELFRVFFWYHNVQRAMGDADALAVHPWWYYGPRLIIDTMPAFLIAPIAAASFIRRRAWRADSAATRGLSWFGVVVAVLSCASFKRADYLLPAYPALAVFLGAALEMVWAQFSPSWRWRALAGAVCIVGIMMAAWVWWLHIELPRLEPTREHKSFADHIRRAAPQPQVILFFRTEAHALAFHLGRPVNTFLEWENLEIWARRPGPNFIVMPPECAAEWSQHVGSGRLEEIARNTDATGGRHEKPLVLMRILSGKTAPYGPPGEQTPDCPSTVDRGFARPECGDRP